MKIAIRPHDRELISRHRKAIKSVLRREIRYKFNYVKTFSKLVGMKQAALSRMFNTDCMPQEGTLTRILQVLGQREVIVDIPLKTKVRASEATQTLCSYLSDVDTVVILYNPKYLKSLSSKRKQKVFERELYHAIFILSTGVT